MRRRTPIPIALSLGDGAADALRAAGHANVRPIHDEFSFGPLGDLSKPEAFTDMRARYWAGVLAKAPYEKRDKGKEFLSETREFLAKDMTLLDEAFSSSGALEVWASESLQDMIFLALCATLVMPETTLILRRPGSGARPPASGIGGFSLDQLKQSAEPHALDNNALDNLRRFWHAVTAKNLEALLAFQAETRDDPSGLEKAASARLARLPHQDTGLDSVETRILSQLSRGSQHPQNVARLIGETLGANADGPDLIGDLSFYHALRRLGDLRLPSPLVTLTGDGPLRGTDIVLTPFGEEVIAGRADRIAANGWRIELGGISFDVPPGGDVPRSPV
ncbi:MAG: DUF1835 domain-containing protein [Pseudomonadota bacterium]